MTTRRDQILADIKDTVDRRARHEVLDDVTKTLSDWNVADIVAGEYHGRFLIELLQNARDAFLEVPDAKDGVVRVRLTSEPALVVANQGAPLTTKVLLQSIGRFGLGTKTKGLSIGHKGIGFKSVLEKNKIYNFSFDLDFKNPSQEDIQNVVNSNLDCDGIFCDSDIIALNVIQSLKKAGRSVPDDVQVIGFDNIELSRIFSPKLTTIAQSSEKIGHYAVETLVKLMNGEPIERFHTQIDVTLIERETTR